MTMTITTSVRPESQPSSGARAWMGRAACATRPDIDFFPEEPDSEGPALRLCGTCPVRLPCLEHAIAHRELGIWGGTNEGERRRIRLRSLTSSVSRCLRWHPSLTPSCTT